MRARVGNELALELLDRATADCQLVKDSRRRLELFIDAARLAATAGWQAKGIELWQATLAIVDCIDWPSIEKRDVALTEIAYTQVFSGALTAATETMSRIHRVENRDWVVARVTARLLTDGDESGALLALGSIRDTNAREEALTIAVLEAPANASDALLREGIDALSRGDEPLDAISFLTRLCKDLAGQQRPAMAARAALAARSIAEKIDGDDDECRGHFLASVARSMIVAGQWEEAVGMLRACGSLKTRDSLRLALVDGIAECRTATPEMVTLAEQEAERIANDGPRARAFYGLAVIARNSLDAERERHLLQKATAALRDAAVDGSLVGEIANHWRELGEPERAVEVFDERLSRIKVAIDADERLDDLLRLAFAAEMSGLAGKAVQIMTEAEAFARILPPGGRRHSPLQRVILGCAHLTSAMSNSAWLERGRRLTTDLETYRECEHVFSCLACEAATLGQVDLFDRLRAPIGDEHLREETRYEACERLVERRQFDDARRVAEEIKPPTNKVPAVSLVAHADDRDPARRRYVKRDEELNDPTDRAQLRLAMIAGLVGANRIA